MAGDIMQYNNKALRELAEKNLKRHNNPLRLFFLHTVILMLFLGLGWLHDGQGEIFFWIFLFLGHVVISYKTINHMAKNHHEWAIQEEMARIRDALLSPDKAKRKVSLGDDGELVEAEEADDFGQSDQRRQQSQY
jgi:hypothetical protein